MSIVRVEPFEELKRMQRQVDQLLEDIFPKAAMVPRWTIPELQLQREPLVEMFETENEVVVKAALPNIDPKMMDITVTSDAIMLKGETKHAEEAKGKNYYRRELHYGTFLRTLPFFTEVKSAEAKATYKDGILEVKVPKSERAKATSVKVKVD